MAPNELAVEILKVLFGAGGNETKK